MSDPRPSENTDKPFAAVAEYGRTHLGWGRTETPADTEQNPIEDLIERAQNASDPGFGLVLAQLATVRAVQAQTEQLPQLAGSYANAVLVFFILVAVTSLIVCVVTAATGSFQVAIGALNLALIFGAPSYLLLLTRHINPEGNDK